jgi:hypothetical protein
VGKAGGYFLDVTPIARPHESQCPALLRVQIDHADRLARVLTTLYEGARASDPALFWLTGRAEEVAVFVLDVHAAWRGGELTTARASDAIARYLRSLHLSLESWYGPFYAPSCCGAHAPESEVRRTVRPCEATGDAAASVLPRDTLPDGAARVAGFVVKPLAPSYA